MKIFLTGGTGFIGKYVTRKLNNGTNELLLLVRNLKDKKHSGKINYLEGSLENIDEWANALKAFKPDAAIHLAWEGIPDYGAENNTRNLKYGLDLFLLLSKTDCKTILTTGSVWEYGKTPGKLPEDLPIEPFNSFTAAKNSLNWMGREIANENNMHFIWTRLFYVYGPGQKNTSLISYLINCMEKEKIPEIRNPEAQNDFIYVEDVADAISKLILEHNQSNTFNIGSGELTSVQTIISKIYDIYGRRVDYQISKQIPIDKLPASYADISKIKQVLNWHPQVSIGEGLKKSLKYVKI